MNRCFEKETCTSTRNKYGAYLWPFRTQHFHQNRFYRRKRRGKFLFPMSREQEEHYKGRKAKLQKGGHK